MESPTTISISPIKSEDIPDVANIYMLTCLLDNAMKFNYPTPQQFVQATIDTLEIRFEDPAWRAIKAVDTATTTISAWACWVTVLPGEKRARNEEGGFNAFLQGEIDGMLEKWTGGEKYISCKACFTLPEFQGRGMGKAMIKYGNEVADKEGLPIYLLASPAVRIVFLKPWVKY